MSEAATDELLQAEEGPLLSWEDLGTRSPGKAFRQSLRELLLHPGRFFDKMATSGGLREPLTFFWILATAGVLLGFPLALSYFALTAPDPAEVPTELYNRHLFAPRAAGFAIVLLPVVLILAGLMQVLAGSLFHLGARLFGARNWEGSVSVWCYAKSAAAVPFVVAEAAACLICLACYLLSLASPGLRGDLGRGVRTVVWILGSVGAIGGCVLFFTALGVGCTRAWRLEAASGAAAALAGFLAAVVVALGTALSFVFWGWKRGLLAGLAAIVIVAILVACGGLSARRSEGHNRAA